MRELPKIMLGGPVRDRAWSAGEWLIALLNQDYPPELMRIVVLVNDSQDETREVCGWIRDRYGWMVAGFEVHERNFGCTVDNNDRRGRRDYHQFAAARNAWLDLRQGEDYVWSVDSDVICPPGILSGLVANRLDLCSAIIENNVGASEWHVNVLKWLDPERGLAEGFWWPPDAIESTGLYECDVTGACFLIHRWVLDCGVRYAYHPLGEDAPFCWAAQQAGFRLFADGTLRADHRMKPPAYTGVESREYCSMMAEMWDWRRSRVSRIGHRVTEAQRKSLLEVF